MEQQFEKGFRLKARKASGLKIHPGRIIRTYALVVLSLCLSPVARGRQPAASLTPAPAPQTVVLPKSVPDPLEPVNRVMWKFNR